MAMYSVDCTERNIPYRTKELDFWENTWFHKIRCAVEMLLWRTQTHVPWPSVYRLWSLARNVRIKRHICLLYSAYVATTFINTIILYIDHNSQSVLHTGKHGSKIILKNTFFLHQTNFWRSVHKIWQTDARKCECLNLITSLKHKGQICSDICCSRRNKSTVFLNLTS